MKKAWSIIATTISTAGTLAGCGGKAAKTTTAAPETITTIAVGAEATMTAEGKADLVPIVVGASPAPHAEILEVAKEILTEQGYDLQIKEYMDHVQPNLALDTGNLDANYFQHYPYSEQFDQGRGTKTSSVVAIHYEPFDTCTGKTTSLDASTDGAKVAVPNDATNEAEVLLLLEAQRSIKLKEGAGLDATKNDVVENVKKLDVFEVEAAQTPRSLQDVDIAVINGNYVIEAGLGVSDALAIEGVVSIAATTYGNIAVVQGGYEKDDVILALVDTLTSDMVKGFIKNKYAGMVVPLF